MPHELLHTWVTKSQHNKLRTGQYWTPTVWACNDTQRGQACVRRANACARPFAVVKRIYLVFSLDRAYDGFT